MRFRRIIKNAIPGKSVVHKFNKNDLTTSIQEVTYAVPPLKALVNYYEQFILGNFDYEKYPAYIEGTKRSGKVKDIFYYKTEDFIIRSSPYTEYEKWRFFEKSKKAILPERKKKTHLVIRRKDNEYTSTGLNKLDRDINKTGEDNNVLCDGKGVVRYKENITRVRRRILKRNKEEEEGRAVQGNFVKPRLRRKPQ